MSQSTQRPKPRPTDAPDLDKFHADIARNLKRLRAERGWSVADLARESKVSRGTIDRLEAGLTGGFVPTIAAIGEGFGLDLPGIVTELTKPPKR